MSHAANKKLMQEIFGQIATGKGTPFAATLADNIVMRVTGQYTRSQTCVGRKAVLRDMHGHVRRLVERGSRTIPLNFYADGDNVVVDARGDMITKTASAASQTSPP